MADIYSFEPFWGTWRIVRILGEGSYGKVYLISREDLGGTYYAALKHLSIPASPSQTRELYADGLVTNDTTARKFYTQMLNTLINEIRLNDQLKGYTNIVSYEEHMILEKTDEPGYDLFIRMEYLTSLSEYTQQHPLSIGEVIRLGEDICSALTILKQEKIVHRDIKPANIFINQGNYFKLGDFGVARTMDRTVSSMSVKGTFTYMAPEVAKGEEGSFGVDVYSLGLVMYKLLNGNRAPFLPPLPQPVTHADTMTAQRRRFQGEALPPPAYAPPALADIILKACAYRPEDRWADPRLMGDALRQCRAQLTPEQSGQIVLRIAQDPEAPSPELSSFSGPEYGETVAMAPEEYPSFTGAVPSPPPPSVSPFPSPSVSAVPKKNRTGKKGPLLVGLGLTLLLLLTLLLFKPEAGLKDTPGHTASADPAPTPSATVSLPFTDADFIRNKEAVSALANLYILNGKDDGSFVPAEFVTRGQMAKIIAGAVNADDSSYSNIKDTPSFSDIRGHWAESYIEFCYGLGIISGRGDGTFGPDGNVTGLEVTKMVLGALGYQSEAYQLTGPNWDTQTQALALDASPSLYTGLDNINMSAYATRDTAAQLIWNGLQNTTRRVTSSIDPATGEVLWDCRESSFTLLEERSGEQARRPESAIKSQFSLSAAQSIESDTSIPADKISIISPDYIYREHSHKMFALLSPYNATDPIVWSIDDPSVATIDADGILTGRSNGYVTITAVCGSCSDSTTVMIGDTYDFYEHDYNSEEIGLSDTYRYINVGDSIQLTASVSPSYPSDAKIVWELHSYGSSENFVFEYNGNTANITAINHGIADVYAYLDGYGYCALCTIEVS